MANELIKTAAKFGMGPDPDDAFASFIKVFPILEEICEGDLKSKCLARRLDPGETALHHMKMNAKLAALRDAIDEHLAAHGSTDAQKNKAQLMSFHGEKIDRSERRMSFEGPEPDRENPLVKTAREMGMAR